MGEVFAGHIGAFVTELDFVMGQFFAVAFDIAVLSPWLATCAVGNFAPYPRHPMSEGNIAFADATVHSTRSDKFRYEFAVLHAS